MHLFIYAYNIIYTISRCIPLRKFFLEEPSNNNKLFLWFDTCLSCYVISGISPV